METDEAKTYRLSASRRRWLYAPIGVMAFGYALAVPGVTIVEYDPMGLLAVHAALLVFLGFGALLAAESRTRICFYETHLFYYGQGMDLLFTHRIPWDTVKEIRLERVPHYKAALYFKRPRNRLPRIEIPLFFFAQPEEIVGQFNETAKKMGITLREIGPMTEKPVSPEWKVLRVIVGCGSAVGGIFCLTFAPRIFQVFLECVRGPDHPLVCFGVLVVAVLQFGVCLLLIYGGLVTVFRPEGRNRRQRPPA